MTLVDTLDTLVVLGDLEEFESAVKLVIKDVKFDNDIIVSVFETNIRMIGYGLDHTTCYPLVKLLLNLLYHLFYAVGCSPGTF